MENGRLKCIFKIFTLHCSAITRGQSNKEYNKKVHVYVSRTLLYTRDTD